jgi:hypothetical protein
MSPPQVAVRDSDAGRSCCIWTNRDHAEKAAEAFTRTAGGSWTVQAFDTEEKARAVIERTATRHPEWVGWVVDGPTFPGDVPADVVAISTAELLGSLH